jgi:glycosyltransferase involved in cell wall biosynthesis
MRILVVSPEYPPYSLGGGGLIAKLLAEKLKQNDQSVVVLAGKHKVNGFFDPPLSAYNKGVHVVWLPLFPTPKTGFQLNTIMPPNARSTSEILRTFFRGDFDVVQVHGFGHFFVDFALALSILTRKPYVYTIHGFPKEPARRGGALKIIFNLYSQCVGRSLVGFASKIIAVSTSLAQECELYARAEKIKVIRNAIDYFTTDKPSDVKISQVTKKYNLRNKSVILAIGRLSQAKGFQYAIEALSTVLKQVPNAHLLIVGKDEGYGYSLELKQQVAKASLEYHVSFLTEVDDEEKISLLWLANAVVIPSTEEVFGLVALEAMASGRLIVASDIGGLTEILRDDKYSTLVPPGKADILASALVAKLEDKKGAEAAAFDGLERVQEFNPDLMVHNYLRIYKYILEKRENSAQK